MEYELSTVFTAGVFCTFVGFLLAFLVVVCAKKIFRWIIKFYKQKKENEKL